MQEKKEDIAEILKRFTGGKATPEEHNRVIRWFESLDSKEKATLDKSLQANIKKRLWANLDDRIQKNRSSSGKSVRKLYPVLQWGIAASLLLFISFFAYQYKQSTITDPVKGSLPVALLNKESNTGNQDKVVTLADGTRITLSPGSYITYNDVASDVTRKVTLQGEAFFDVTPNKKRPFMVYTYEVLTTVVGTSFTIKAPSSTESVVVAVATGKVLVSGPMAQTDSEESTGQKVMILPNQQAVFSYASKKLTTSLVQEPVALEKPENAKLVYDEEPITSILHELEEMYGVDIVYDESTLSSCRITTAFTDETLFKRLDILSEAIGATYTMEGTSIIISSNGCN